MRNLDKAGVETLLTELENGGYIEQGYAFCRNAEGGLQLLGFGGFAYVYEMYDTKNPAQRYAVKVVGCGERNADFSFVTETTQIQYILSHQSENIVKIYALWSMKLMFSKDGELTGVIRDGQPEFAASDAPQLQLIVMEKLEGVIEKDRRGNIRLLRDDLRTEDGVRQFAAQIGRALFIMHENGYLHRDVKLENISWDGAAGSYKLGDFDIARFVGDGDAQTVVYTDGYGAPEIERRLAYDYDQTADIYSFGVTLYLLLNDLKFPASDKYLVNAAAQYSKDFIFPAPKNASGQLARIVQKMCSYSSADRYQSVEEVLMDLGRIDGTYTDKGFVETGEDSETEYYSEGEQRKDGAASVGKPEKKEWWKKRREEMTREESKRADRAEDGYYTEVCVRTALFSSIIFFVLFKSFAPNPSYAADLGYFLLFAALIVEALLQKIRELNVLFGTLICLLSAYLMYKCGVSIVPIAAIFAVLAGMSPVTAGCGIGCGLWLAQVISERLEWLSVLNRWDMGWVALIALFVVIQDFTGVRALLGRMTYRGARAWCWITARLAIAMVLVGIVLLAAQRAGVLSIPDILARAHLIRTGIGIYAAQAIYNYRNGVLNGAYE